MHFLSLLTVLLLSVCSTLAQYVYLESFDDGTYAYANSFALPTEPTPEVQSSYAEAAYREMVADADRLGIEIPGTMSAAWWPNANGNGGTFILHSSIKGGAESGATRDYVNGCNLGGHRYRGMCGEIANMAWAKSMQDAGTMNSNNQVRWAVFGLIDPETGEEGFMLPCGARRGYRGCDSYVYQLAQSAGGGGQCLVKRIPEPIVPLKPTTPKPVPDAPPPAHPDAPTTNNPDAPDAPDRLTPGGDRNPNDPANPADKPEDRLTGDKPDAQTDKDKDKGFEEGAICKLPTRNTRPPMSDIPDPSGLTNFVPPPDQPARKLKLIRGMTRY